MCDQRTSWGWRGQRLVTYEKRNKPQMGGALEVNTNDNLLYGGRFMCDEVEYLEEKELIKWQDLYLEYVRLTEKEFQISGFDHRQAYSNGISEERLSSLRLGLYRIFWRSGGWSLAAVGMDESKLWFAPTNWITVPCFKWKGYVLDAVLLLPDESKSG